MTSRWMRIVAASVTALTCLTSPLWGQAGFDYGEAWRVRPEDSKLMYVAGVADAIRYLDAYLGMRMDGRIPANGAGITQSTTPAFDSLTPQSRAVIALQLRREFDDAYVRFDQRRVAELVTQLYDDRANSYVDWYTMVHVAVMRLRGDPDSKVSLVLQAARFASARSPLSTPKP